MPDTIRVLNNKECIVVDYDIWGQWIVDDLLKNVPSSTYVLVTDTNLHDRYVPKFQKAFEHVTKSKGSNARLLVKQVPPGETSKSRRTKDAVEDWMLAKERDPPCDRKSVIIALGGGVIGDMFGYVAATFMRGIRFVQVPTTLLAMVDSSIGGKTAIDVPAGKNLIGAIHQPEKIYIDLSFLNTLPSREIINGMAEVIKTAAIWDADKFAALERNSEVLMQAFQSPPDPSGKRLAGVKDILKEIVLGSAAIKAEVVSKDEREGGLRNLLNYGHSIGHAFEGILTPQILHGECVAIGMVLEGALARYLGYLSNGAVSRLTACIQSYGLPTTVHDPVVQARAKKICPVDRLMAIMGVDKKNEGRTKRIALLAGIGRTYEPHATSVEDRHIRLILSEAVNVHAGTVRAASTQVRPPGSKSISNRALVLAALGKGETRIRNLLHSDDTEVMLRGLTDLKAATFAWEDDGEVLVVKGRGGQMQACQKPLYLGNAGTAARFLTSVVAIAKPAESNSCVLTGNHRMKVRPIGPLVDSLRANGAEVEYLEGHGCLPLRIGATEGLAGGDIELKATVSSQYVSSILLCAPYAKKPITLRLVGGKVISQPYIDMTIAMMKTFGVNVKKSKTEEHTYHIPTGHYINPSVYEVESDASSATYPMALAAITGTTVTVDNIGSESLQGDARFAVDVLRPMGCTVEQTKSSTTVTGPSQNNPLQPLPDIDMEPMTDAFLTAAVLGAVAQKSSGQSTTRIRGIANQRVKECNRIQAMEDELHKFGVTCRQFDDGIEVDGIPRSHLKQPSGGIHCYDDHRVAMSFSVLAAAAPKDTLIQDRECTAKTWPGWWDVYRGIFGASLDGIEVKSSTTSSQKKASKSIFVVGMRGAGKTTAGTWASQVLGWPFIDLDQELEKRTQKTIPDIIKENGWEKFREQEVDLLKTLLKEKPTGHVFACGGGIVETPEARKLLNDYNKANGPVILVQRNVQDIVEYLNIDKTRPAYTEDIMPVWLRRKPWYQESSNYEYRSYQQGTQNLPQPSKDFARFIRFVTGDRTYHHEIEQLDQSFFVSLTTPDVSKAEDQVRAACVGSHAVELRVDLLTGAGSPKQHLDFVAQQVSLLRQITDLPIIFTVRTKAQGGQFPDGKPDELISLYKLGLRLGVEYLDVEMQLDPTLLASIVAMKGSTQIVASHHDFLGQLSWNDGSWVVWYNKALQYGDIIKLVGMARGQEDNDALQRFRNEITVGSTTPLIAINMGTHGQLSRTRNTFLTPVTHSALTTKAAPGQLSATQIRQALAIHGVIQAADYYLFGTPISASRSPKLHNTFFQANGLPHTYHRLDTDQISEVRKVLKSPTFGGASVTIPLKLDIMDELDSVSADAKLIGAVNTVVVSDKPGKHGMRYLTGHNTDWQGMVKVLDEAGAQRQSGNSALVVGTGGTARAAIYALHSMGYAPIYLVARDAEKAAQLAGSFPSEYGIEPLTDRDQAKEKITSSKKGVAPAVGIATVPASKPIDEKVVVILTELFGAPLPSSSSSSGDSSSSQRRVLLEMAYVPAVTELMQLAQRFGWTTVNGLEVLAAQGLFQFRLWTGIAPLWSEVRQVVVGGGKGQWSGVEWSGEV